MTHPTIGIAAHPSSGVTESECGLARLMPRLIARVLYDELLRHRVDLVIGASSR